MTRHTPHSGRAPLSAPPATRVLPRGTPGGANYSRPAGIIPRFGADARSGVAEDARATY